MQKAKPTALTIQALYFWMKLSAQDILKLLAQEKVQRLLRLTDHEIGELSEAEVTALVNANSEVALSSADDWKPDHPQLGGFESLTADQRCAIRDAQALAWA